MKAGAKSTAPRRLGAALLDDLAASPELDSLGDLADEYTREIRRSPFFEAFASAGVAPMAVANPLSPFLGADYGFGWYPSHLLRDEKLRQPPDLSVRMAHGLLAGVVDPRHRERIEQQHRSALARQFIADRDAHPAYRRLREIAGFPPVLEAFATARDRSKPASSLRAPQAEAQLISCIVRPLWRLNAKTWRPAPTEDTARKARKAAKALIAAGKEGLHSLPSYFRATIELRSLLRELDAPTGRQRAPRLDANTARSVTVQSFEERLAATFGADAFDADLRGVRLAYVALLGFQNPRDKLSP